MEKYISIITLCTKPMENNVRISKPKVMSSTNSVDFKQSNARNILEFYSHAATKNNTVSIIMYT